MGKYIEEQINNILDIVLLFVTSVNLLVILIWINTSNRLALQSCRTKYKSHTYKKAYRKNHDNIPLVDFQENGLTYE